MDASEGNYLKEKASSAETARLEILMAPLQFPYFKPDQF